LGKNISEKSQKFSDNQVQMGWHLKAGFLHARRDPILIWVNSVDDSMDSIQEFKHNKKSWRD